MKTRIVLGVLIVVLLVVGGLAVYAWSSTPKLAEVYPLEGGNNVPATTAIRLVFSRAMQTESVLKRFKIEPLIQGSYTWEENALTFTPDQAWPAGSLVSLSLESGARAARWLSFPMGGQSWSFKTNETMLAYLWPSEGAADIYALAQSTGPILRLTHGMGVLDFTVSSNGIRIYFSASNPQGGANLYLIDRSQVLSSAEDSYDVQEVLDCAAAQCRNLAVSPDNQSLAYEYIQPDPSGGSGPAVIWMFDLKTMKASPVGLESHETFQPAWSSKGELAYYDSTSSGYEVLMPNSGDRVLLLNQTGQPGDWSPDGQFYLAPEIYYYQAPENTERGTSHLIRYKISDNTNEDISKSLDVEDAEAVYSPDGIQIAFSRKFLDAAHWTLGRQIWIMNADGSDAHPITDEADLNHYDLAWSRDGTMLAYVRFDETRVYNPPELWMVNADGSDPIQLVIGGYAPIWIP
jgi:Tol biopolymer transport system component